MSGGFNNPIIGGGGALVYPSIHSPNFSAGPPITGWSIDKNGNAFFSGTFTGTNYIFNSAGMFFYNGTPAAGNLIMSIVGGPNGTDQFGNNYIGQASTFYNNAAGFAVSIFNDAIQWFHGSLSGGWTSDLPLLQRVASGTLSIDNPVLIGGITPATSATAEVQGTAQVSGIISAGGGTNSSGSAPSPAQSLTINAAAAQLSDLTRDYMLYLTFSGAGNVTVQAGPTSAVGRTIYPTAAAVAGAPYPVRMPAGWFIKCTGTGTVAIASQTVVGC